MNEYTREKIRMRMLKRISQIWDVEQMNQIDPIVKLLIEGMSEEIFMLTDELNGLDDRLLSKLSSLLTPVNYQSAQPAHGILTAYPTESALTIDSTTSFSYKEAKILRKYDIDSIDFIPVAPFRLIQGNIEYLNICGQMYQCGEFFRRDTVALPMYPSASLNNTLWIGVNVQDSNIDLQNVSFYFDFRDIKDTYPYLKLLRQAQWSINGESVEVQCEMNKEDALYKKSLSETICSDIQSLYDIHYVTLGKHSMKKETFPEELKSVYSKDMVEQFKTPLLWVKIVFMASVPDDVLKNIQVGMNMFPIANISRRKIAEPMGDVSLFLPLKTENNEFFMEVTSVSDSSGKIYEPLGSEKENGIGFYSLRKGGVERFGNTNASASTAARLVDILRDRNLFSTSQSDREFNQLVMDTTFSINKISAALSKLEDATLQQQSYMIVDKSNPNETLYVDYLTTNGAVVNKMRIDSPISSNESIGLDVTKTRFVTALRSGKSDLPTKQIQDIHSYMLTSHDRIVTKHDIISYCKAVYGADMNAVSIKTGSQVSKNPKEGLIKTIDVYVTLKENAYSKNEIENEKTDLLCKLEQRSPESYHYRLFMAVEN